ncbi:MAG: S8 family serine peptidase [Bacteroidota bacterium]
MKYLLLIFAALLTAGAQLQAQQQTETGLYFIGFQDKAGTPFSVDRPEEFLSARALARREKHQATITQEDLPISPDYVNQVLETGAEIWLRSKWMNGVVILANGQQIKEVKKLSFVDTTYYTAPSQYDRSLNYPKIPNLDRPAPKMAHDTVSRTFYGAGYRNLTRMKGDSLHQMGYRGAGMLVAVLDGGFPMVGYKDFLGYDDPAAVPANWDVVEQDETAFDGGSHGSTVLSTMAAHHPFFFIGMAPEARYVLFKTENGRGEHRQEEINYAVALEVADSIGVDVANSSLGYTTFNDGDMNYSYQDMNGRTSPASVAIDNAFERGMIIVTSAGNSGSDDWKYISAPADANKSFSIGALDADDDRAYFSSFGPTADGRIKPDVSAPGVNVPAVATNGRGLQGANGTSLSSPLVCALVTCLWQAFPEATNQEILDAIRQTAGQANQPDNTMGYGLPNFAAAYRRLAQKR